MKREPLEPEVLAALLEGTLPADERDQVMERLAESPDDYEAFVEAASVLRDLDDDRGAAPAPPPPASPPPPPVRDIRTARRRFPGAKLWLPLAAVLAGVLVVSRLVVVDRAAASVALLERAPLVPRGGRPLGESLGEEWNRPGWTVRRGGAQSLAERQRDFRIGARLAELDAAHDAGDAVAVQDVVPELISLVSRIDGSERVLEPYERISERASRREGMGTDEDLSRAAADLAAFLHDSPWFGLGIWVEQARLATLANQPRFFDARAARILDELTGRVAEQQGEDAPLVQQLRALRRLADEVPQRGLGPVRAPLEAIIRTSGG